MGVLDPLRRLAGALSDRQARRAARDHVRYMPEVDVDRVQEAAELLHRRLHQAGRVSTCAYCRALAEEIGYVLIAAPLPTRSPRRLPRGAATDQPPTPDRTGERPMPDEPAPEVGGPDTGDLIDPDADDPTPEEITDRDHPDYVEPHLPGEEA